MDLTLILTLLAATVFIGEMRHKRLSDMIKLCNQCLEQCACKLSKVVA